MSADERATIRLQLEGARETVAGLHATEKGVAGLRRETDRLAASTEHARRRSFLMNQALFTLRRFAYAGTLALVGLGAASVALGFQFNMTMEGNQIAFEQFLGSASAARQELDLLYHLAAVTPFEFADLTGATRRFLAFGYTLQETNTYLKIIGDTVAAFGASPEMIQRMVLVFGQIRASGRLLGQDMLQLQQQGIPVIDILSKKLGIASSELARVGDLAIPASVAIPALMEGMEERFGGAAARQAKTMQGQLTTIKDYAAQLMGTLTMPIFDRMRKSILPQIGRMIGEMQRYARRQQQRGQGVSFMHIIGIADESIGAGGNLVRVIGLISLYMRGLVGVIRNGLLPAVRDIAMVYGPPLYAILLAVGHVFAFLGEHGLLARIMLTYLIASFVTARLTAMALFWWNFRLAAIWGVMAFRAMWAGRAIRIQAFAMRFLTFWTGLYTAATVGSIRGTNGQFISMTRLQKLVRLLAIRFRVLRVVIFGYVAAIRVATAATITFLLTNPIGWIILLVAGLALLYWKFERLRPIFHSLLMLMSPLVFVVYQLSKHFRTLAHWAGRAAGFLGKIPGLGLAGRAFRGAKGLIGLQGGGTVTRGGMFMVGERGPELAVLPAAARVSPIGLAAGDAGMAMGPLILDITIPLKVDGRKLAEVTAKHRLDRKARS